MTYNTDRMMREATLPGMVKEERSEYDLICYARDEHREFCKVDGQNLNRAIECGKTLILIRERSKEERNWLEKLSQTKIPQCTAYDYMKVAAHVKCFGAPKVLLCGSFREALKYVKDQEPEEVTTEEAPEEPSVSENGRAKHKPKPKPGGKKPPKGSPRATHGAGADDDTQGMPYETSVVRDRAAYPNRIEEFFDTREMTKAEAEAAKRAFEKAFEVFVDLAGRPERPAFLLEKECWHCHKPVIVGRTEATNRVMVVESAKKGGGFEIIDGKIASCAGGRYKNHHAFCTKGFTNGQR